MADDLSVVNAARVSFAQRATEMTDREAGPVRFLMRERHGTPFEHNASASTSSARSSSRREWHAPPHRLVQRVVGAATPSSSPSSTCRPPRTCAARWASPAPTPSSRSTPDLAEHTREAQQAVYDHAYQTYEELLEQGVAKEVARNVLPVAIYTQFYWTVNARSLMNFLRCATPRPPSARSAATPRPSRPSSPARCRSRTPRSWTTSAAHPKKALTSQRVSNHPAGGCRVRALGRQ